MTISFVGSSTVGGNLTSTSTSAWNVNRPAGTIVGDFMVAYVTSAQLPSLPAGWTQLRAVAAGQVHLSVWYKWCGANEPASYAVDSRYPKTTSVCFGVTINTYRGVLRSAPINAISSNQTADGTTMSNGLSTGNITTTVADCTLISVSSARRGSPIASMDCASLTGPSGSSSGDTRLAQPPGNGWVSGTTFNRTHATWWRSSPVATGTHTRAFRFTSTPTSQAVVLIALAPAPVVIPPVNQSISHVGTTTSFSWAANGTTRACAVPANVQKNDMLFAFVTNWAKAPTAPGWTWLRSSQPNDQLHYSVWYRIATDSEPASYSFGGGTSSPSVWGMTIQAYRGVNYNNPFIAINHNSSTATGTANVSTGSITIPPEEDAAWILYGVAVRRPGNGSGATVDTIPSSGHLERADLEGRTTGANNASAFIRAMATFDSNGPVGPGTYSFTAVYTNASSSTARSGLILALRPMPMSEQNSYDETPPANRVSARFIPALYGSHEVVSYVDVTSPTGARERLQVIEGGVEVDKTAEVRRRVTLKCIDPDGTLTPEGIAGILTPYGTEIRPYRGIRFSSDPDDFEVQPLGVFRIQKVEVQDTLDGLTLDIEASDRSRTISRHKFTSVYTVSVGTNLLQAIYDIVRRTFPSIAFNTIGTSRVVESLRVYDIGDDPWEAIQELATSMGYDVYFDVYGRLCVLPFPDIENLPSPVFEYVEGEQCVLMDLSRTLDDSPGYNGVVVIGEAPSDDAPPIIGIAWDDVPTSATYYQGPYGAVPMFHQDQLVKNTQEATNTAKALLKAQLGFSSGLSMTGLPNPLYECGDVVRVTRERSRVNDVYVVDAFNVPLRASGTQGLTLRQKR